MVCRRSDGGASLVVVCQSCGLIPSGLMSQRVPCLLLLKILRGDTASIRDGGDYGAGLII